jgi:hypothetical protein
MEAEMRRRLGSVIAVLTIAGALSGSAALATDRSVYLLLRKPDGPCEIVVVVPDPIVVVRGDKIHWLFLNECGMPKTAVIPAKDRRPKYKKHPDFPTFKEEDPLATACGDAKITIPADGVYHDVACDVSDSAHPRVYKYLIKGTGFDDLDPEVEVRDVPPIELPKKKPWKSAPNVP